MIKKLQNHLKILVVTNIITLVLLVIISAHYDLPSKLIEKSGIFYTPECTYAENPDYFLKRSLFRIYKPKKVNIVMLGNSITHNANWNDLLSRTDIANRGIGNDITAGFLNRLDDIYRLKPKLCFIMGGINDIRKNIDAKLVYENYKSIILELKSNKIIPIIQSTLYVSKKHDNYHYYNNKVKKLNKLLLDFSIDHNIDYIDVNSALSDNNNIVLLERFTYDGIHLLANGYEEWGGLIVPIIDKYKDTFKGTNN